jgi:hypothetical protein
MPPNVEALRSELRSRQPTDLVRKAIEFLARPDLTLDHFAEAGGTVVEHLLPIYRTRLKALHITGLVQFGLADFVQALSSLPPSTQLSVAVFHAAEWAGHFWSDEAGRVVGTVLLKRRPPEEERERREWFDANLT